MTAGSHGEAEGHRLLLRRSSQTIAGASWNPQLWRSSGRRTWINSVASRNRQPWSSAVPAAPAVAAFAREASAPLLLFLSWSWAVALRVSPVLTPFSELAAVSSSLRRLVLSLLLALAWAWTPSLALPSINGASALPSCSTVSPYPLKRYRGYCAWRGVLDISSEGGSEVYKALRKQYPNLGYSLYFDIADRTHAVLYELPGGRLNWLWYVNQSEPQLKGTSVTAKADEIAIAKMHAEAARVWMPELSALMQLTPAPFINAIVDREPVLQLVWGRVVLVGEAAHPTSPHGLRSTNMSILDAAVLGESFTKYGSKIKEALDEYQSLCMPVTSQQVLFSRYLVQQGSSSRALYNMRWVDCIFEESHWEIFILGCKSFGCFHCDCMSKSTKKNCLLLCILLAQCSNWGKFYTIYAFLSFWFAILC